MSEACAMGSDSTRLQLISEALVRAYRGMCRHAEDSRTTRCSSCDQIDEVRDMIQCSAGSIFEALALCAHFQQELNALDGGASQQVPARSTGGASGTQSA